SQTVTYVYQQQGTVTVRYVDTNDKELAKPVTLTGGVNEPYDTTQKEFSGYKFVEVKGAPASGEFKPESQTVTYVYQQQGTVTVRYVDMDDKELAEPITLTGGVNEPYQTEPKEISGYKFVEVKGAPAAGEFKAENQTVTYVYQQQGTVTVRYVDMDDKELAEPITLTGGVNEPYQTEPEKISGYKFVEVKGAPATGEFKAESQTVTYVYQLLTGTVVTEHVYIDDNNNETQIVDAIEKTYNHGETYLTEEQNFEGFEFIRTEGGTPTGTVTGGSVIHVKYIYKEIKGTVTIIGYDENKNEIYRKTISERVGTEYAIQPPEIPGYLVIDNILPDNAQGEYIDGNIDVIFYYSSEQGRIVQTTNIVFKDYNTGGIIDEGYSEIATDGENYSYTIKSIPGYYIERLVVDMISGFPLPFETSVSPDGQSGTISGVAKGDVIITVYLELTKQ
ncbi:MucBP domain-containing protein, partial [Vagococcus elongatus]